MQPATNGQTTEQSQRHDVFVARQGILDRDSKTFAYELLFRNRRDQNFFAKVDGNLATCQTINNSLNVMGLSQLVGQHRAFINVTEDVLVRDMYLVLPPEQTVIEILETIKPTGPVVEACRRAKQAGYLLALDDFVMQPGFDELVDLSDFIKIDFLATPPEQRESITESFSSRAACLLAEKIETHDDFQQALALGYSYFQGYFFCKPEIHAGKQIPAFKRNYLRFLHEVTRPQLDFAAIEAVIKEEPSLSVKLLRYLNSASLGIRTKIASIRQGVALLGERPLRQWAALVALTSMGDEKPTELLSICLIRARFCEIVGALAGCSERETDCFFLGLLSALDAMVDRPLTEVLADLPIAPDVKAALLGSRTLLATIFNLALACERGNTTLANMLAKKVNLADEQIANAQYEAMLWADQVMHDW